MELMEEIIIKYLAEGKTQKEISDLLKYEGVKPNSQSSVEKYLNKIRKKYGAKTNFHLAVILIKSKKL